MASVVKADYIAKLASRSISRPINTIPFSNWTPRFYYEYMASPMDVGLNLSVLIFYDFYGFSIVNLSRFSIIFFSILGFAHNLLPARVFNLSSNSSPYCFCRNEILVCDFCHTLIIDPLFPRKKLVYLTLSLFSLSLIKILFFILNSFIPIFIHNIIS